MTRAALDALGDRFEACFTAGTPTWRTLGREAEFPLVNEDGTAADAAPVLAWLGRADPTLNEKREGEQLVALYNERVEYTLEVGRGTMEVIVGPTEDLHQLQAAHDAAKAPFLDAADALGVTVLGYGIQPITAATPAFMTPKSRYAVLLATVGSPWLWFTLTASDQVHAAIGRDELVDATNICNLLTPVTVALCANSPVFSGSSSGSHSAREARMGDIHAGTFRHGMPGGPDADARAMVRRLADQALLVTRRDGIIRAASGTFTEHLAGLDDETAWNDFLLHEHYIWNSARPRTVHSTLEMRSACQQPLHESGASAALSVGLVCGWRRLEAFVEEALGPEAWPTMHRYHADVIKHGLSAPEPVDGFLAGVLACCAAALAERDRGEEALLAPLFRRLETRRNPAQDALDAFARGGMPALIRETARR
jgi:gamma-glutamylcysteine synthetase